ncbi:hypothetical protein SB394_11805 [Burkholderia sp. BCCIQ04A]|uniref:Uncharacterized protein n=1 Tax=Burkholderia anthinoferrum TaxID=3090833 RepID=A0ABU5WNM8_9BURK|nr:hypothetical protein [Burkholderia anthinoferrum]MEB2504596.1 hypothetical protein [Burkholderia anthinoferrum]MEB2530265.1 hypothetical protein [Burkholderia anthinoferrum]MEB2561638.1 hypothetical protein [Burkholderia anthinoferrum]MEB2580612.1 hypothetical protein [Burkholderia anthinoferrum]MEB2634410.1 hypothetical protein [Burkholderia anthinoferrum]
MSTKPNCDCLNDCGDGRNVENGTAEPCIFFKMRKARDEAREAALRARNAAVRTLEAKGYTYVDGAEQWKPPLGKPPAWVAHDTQAVRDVIAERRRQVEQEGWTPEHDDEHDEGQMAAAAGYYALASSFPHSRDLGRGQKPAYWPWGPSWWKPTSARRNLVKAGALILAELERFDRAGDES